MLRLQVTVLDRPDPPALAAFWSAVLGIDVDHRATQDDWMQLLGQDEGVPTLAFQLAPGARPRPWPDPDGSALVHLDVEVDDLDAGERAVLALGARKVDTQPDERWRVFLDPVGHPFCLVPPRSSD